MVTSCINTCEKCELCLGKTEIPADCNPTPDAGTDAAPTGGQTCSIGQPCNAAAPCPSGLYCVTGCCIEIVF